MADGFCVHVGFGEGSGVGNKVGASVGSGDGACDGFASLEYVNSNIKILRASIQ